MSLKISVNDEIRSIAKEIVEHLKENGGQAAILFGMKGVCNRFRFADKSDYMPSIERLIERGLY